MSNEVLQLNPALLWKHFYELSQIPRCSKHEEAVRQYVLQVAGCNGLEYKIDAVQSVSVKKPATPGLENSQTVVLQSHLDMVCEKNKDTVHDFSKDPIKLLRDGDWLKADGTTLGADNGIGVAAMLAVMESDDLKHGPMEFLFTIDEETGLTGAIQLGEDMLEGRILLNLDTEEDGHFCIGCAGGRDTELFLKLETEPAPGGYVPALVRVGGLQGGHSGMEIIKGLANGIKLCGRFLWKVASGLNLRLAHIDGGSKHNAIPRECDALIYLPGDKMAELKKLAAEFEAIYKNEYHAVDPGVFVKIDQDGFASNGRVFTSNLQERVLNMLYAMPHGVLAMSQDVEGLVETSTNMAVLKTHADKIGLLTSQRSSVTSGLESMVDMVTAVGLQAGAEVEHHNGYPAWQPNPESPLLKFCTNAWRELFNEEPVVEAVHAGLECGIIGDKFAGMDMISFGPDILGAHSPEERVRIASVEKFWDFLKVLLDRLATQE